MSLSLRARLLGGLTALVVAGMAASAGATYWFLQKSLIDQLDSQLATAVHPGADSLAAGAGVSRPIPSSIDLPIGTYLELREPDGTTVLETRVVSLPGTTITAHPDLPTTVSPPGVDIPALATVGGTGSVDHYRLASERLDALGNRIVLVAIPMTQEESTLERLLLVELAISGAVVATMVATTWLIVSTALRPLERMGETAQAIAAGDLSHRIPTSDGRTEIGRLGLSLNLMLGQIEEAFAERSRLEQRLRRFIADASHELRTPLTSIRGYAEILRRGADRKPDDAALARRRIEEESIRMTGLVEDMLLLARLDQGRPLESAPVDLEHLARDAFHDARAVAPDREVRLDSSGPVVVTGDEPRLRQVVGNLVRNALVHTPSSTPIEVSVQAQEGWSRLAVTDHGPGLDAQTATRIFEPFFRADSGRSRDRGGSGLGLAIVKAVVAAHGGRIDVTQTPGGGATFTVWLPLQARIDRQA